MKKDKHLWEGGYFRRVCQRCECERIRDLDKPPYYRDAKGNFSQKEPECISDFENSIKQTAQEGKTNGQG